MSRLRMATLAWALSGGLTVAAWALGLLEVGPLEMAALLLLVLASQLFFHMALRTGWSERFRDPSMTLAHILLAVLVGLWVISRAGEARTILLMLFILSTFFGAFQLRQREFMLVALVSVSGYTAITIRDLFIERIEASTQVVVLELVGFAFIMLWLAWFGAHIARMRRTLSRRNRELRDLSARLQHLADHDELTGLPNRRRLIAQLESAAKRARQSNVTFSVAVLDLDFFKRINDRYGHQAGDEVLTELARRASDLLRGADALVRVDETIADFGRFGGEEFLAILPGTDLAGASRAAERLRREICEKPFETSTGLVECTASIGVAEHQSSDSVSHTIARADEALYNAKNDGRNRVRTA
ncbi:GGDEF domain-containing protein [Wenzhouxiangella sp. XN201]|uniref:GGDEF domain-containing protein n=1 Tax=Wenzhouxiangella sp. XN201 TaxID=2710755 RepID=UPI0013C64EDF|nr:GGDEF domain-containing protein [Wenzhouxiangella sp. XN201]NEZ03699.1 GGDEF domain-containing protein [Wenzhouxiangella sp. XN201]